MAKNTNIEWATHTFNPWVGCTKISPACDNCYAEGWAKRSGMVKWGAHESRVRTSTANWKQPLKWNKQVQLAQNAWDGFKKSNPGLTDSDLIEKGFIKPKRPRVFCASLADVFDNAVPDEWRADLFSLIAATPYLDWLLLTKRIGNVEKMLIHAIGDSFYPNHENVWIGITVCNQEEADRDIPKLLKIHAAKRFLSIEPMLGEIDLSNIPRRSNVRYNSQPKSWEGWLATQINWVICGGESGSKARPMQREWARYLFQQCSNFRIPFFFKQWGEFAPDESGNMLRVGKKHAGRLLDGLELNEVPE